MQDTFIYSNDLDEFTEVVNHKYFKKNATTSYGIICFTVKKGKVYYLLGQVRDTIAFKEFIRCCIPHNEMLKYISNMSIDEKNKLINFPFFDLLDDTFLNKNTRVYKAALNNEEEYRNNIDKYKHYLIDNDIGLLTNPWIFPKGRKQDIESDIESAIREFKEETQYNPIKICNIKPVEELYKGLDGKLYKTIYYCAMIDYHDYKKSEKNITKVVTKYRSSLSDEITMIKLFSFEDAIKILPDAKQYILRIINNELIFNVLERRNIVRRHSF